MDEPRLRPASPRRQAVIDRAMLAAGAVMLMAAAPAPGGAKLGDKHLGEVFPAWMTSAAAQPVDKAAGQAEGAPGDLEALIAALPGTKWRVDPAATQPGSKDFALAGAPAARLGKAANKEGGGKDGGAAWLNPYGYPPSPTPSYPTDSGLSVPNCPGDPRCPR